MADLKSKQIKFPLTGTSVVSSSAQIATDISGSFVADSGSFSTRITTDSGSFSTRVTTAETELTNTLVSSSAQISTDISGSFVADSGSFSTRITADSGSFSTRVTTAESELGNTLLSSSAQIATDISGSFVADSGSFSTRITTDSGSFSTRVTTAESELGNTLLSSSAQISTDISGSFVEPSASFSTRVTTAETELENTLVSSSAQISTDISGSFVAPSASFSTRVTTAETELENTLVSSSAQLSIDISGSFVAPSASFSTRVTTAESELENTLVSSSAQLSTDISGSFVAPSGSFSTRITTAESELGNTLLSGSAQIATDISGSLSTAAVIGLGAGIISGSSSNSNLTSAIVIEGASIVSASAQLSDDISGSLSTAAVLGLGAGIISGSSSNSNLTTAIVGEGANIVSASAQVDHDSATNFVANEHINHTSVSITAGDGLTGGGDISSTRTINVVGGTGITANANDVATNDSEIVHDNLSGFVANEHIDHTSVTMTAGAGLTGGGTIASTRTLAVGQGTGVTVNANDVAIGQDVGTDQDVTFASVTATGNIVAQGDVIAENYIVSSSVTFMTSSILSGSTRFGDTPADDTHQFTGSLFVTGSTFNIDENGGVSSSASGSFLNVDVSNNLGVSGKFTLPNITDVSASIASAVAGGDDMGNHTATQDLDMDGNDIFDIGHISSSGNISGSAGDILGFASASFSNVDAPHIKATNVHGTILTATQATIDHDSLANFVANEHVDHSSVSVTAGDGLTGGGTIASNRTINVVGGDGITANANDVAITAAQTTIESIYKEDLVIGEDNQTQIDFETANEIHFDVNNSELLNLTGNKISGSQASTGSFGSLVTDANVGIGESNPNVPLEVIGSVSSSASGSFLNVKASNNVNATNLYGTILTATQATIDHDSLANFVANEHIDHSGVTITAGDGLSGGGTIASTRTLAVDATVLRTTGDSVISSSAQLSDDISGSLSTAAVVGLGAGIISGSSSNSSLTTAIVGEGANIVSASAMVDHDSATNFVANEHINHTSVTITAGDGLTGGGTIASTRTLAVGQGTGVTVNANDIAIGQAVETDSNVQFANIIATATASLAKISGSLIESEGDFTLDSSGDIILDADGTDIILKDGGTSFGSFKRASSDFIIKAETADKDILFKGTDDSTTITALTLDMSEGGNAQFLGNISGSQIEASGDVIAFGSSDRELKDNIQPIENPLDKMDKIGGYTFDWNDKQDTYKGHDIGVVAQEIQSVLPEIVATRANGYLGVKYEKIVPLLIESIKELNKKIEDIEKKCDCLNK